jgi:hypothetical protein
VGGSGTDNYIPRWNGSASLENSVIYQDDSGNVGIGQTSPGAKFEVAGQVKITGGTPGLGKVLTSDANGLASWTKISSSVDILSLSTTYQSVTFGMNYGGINDTNRTVNCPVGYVRTGCGYIGGDPNSFLMTAGSLPDGTAGCKCYCFDPAVQSCTESACYVYCMKLN